MAIRLPLPRMQFDKSTGAPAVGYLLYTYENDGGTTDKTTYQDAAGSTPHANPIDLDARGERPIFWDGVYKVILKDADGVTIWEETDYGVAASSSPSDEGNLAYNGSFEIDEDGDTIPDGWTRTLYSGGVGAINTAAVGHGKNSFKFTSVGTGGGYLESTSFIPISELIEYYFEFILKSDIAGVRNLVEIKWYQKDESLISSSSIYDNSTTNPTTFTLKKYAVTPPANARLAKLFFYGCHSSDPSAGSTWYDGVRFHPRPDAFDIADVKTITNTDSPYTVTDEKLVLCDATAGVITVNLPPVVDWPGEIIRVKKIDSSDNAITIDGDGAETIDGATTVTIVYQYQTLSFTNDGTSVYII